MLNSKLNSKYLMLELTGIIFFFTFWGMESISHSLKIWYICFIKQDNYSTCIYERSLQLYIGIIFKRASLCFCRGWLQAVWLTSVLHWFTMTSIVIEIFPKVVLMLVNCLLALNVLPVVNIVMCNINVRKIAYKSK